jgi:hypothetical protein
MTNRTLRIKTPKSEYIADIDDMELEKDLMEMGTTMATEEYTAIFETSELHEVNGNNVVE